MSMTLFELTYFPNSLTLPAPEALSGEHWGGILGWDPGWDGRDGKWLAIGALMPE